MLRDYEDITSRLGEPLWWDDLGAPRYDDFHPEMLGVYDQIAAFMVIGCQNCEREFQVAQSFTSLDLLRREPPKDEHPSAEWAIYLHYGDPPIHGCIGDTMNSEPKRILQFWRKGEKDGWPEWERVEGMEGELPEEEREGGW